MVLSGVWTVMTRSLTRSAIGLALTSLILTVLMFQLGATMAAVFELSVCAGLITVVFISAISMTKALSHDALLQKTRDRLKRYWYLPAILLVVAAALAFVLAPRPALAAALAPAPAGEGFDALKSSLWKDRQTDIIGQIAIIFAGVTGVIVLFKERKGDKE
jgi:NADH-quinone oxidoreductase subunit J